MTADSLAAVEHLDRGGGEARPQLLSDERVRDAVIMAVDLDVVVEGGAHAFPLGIDVRASSASARIAGRSRDSNIERRDPGSFWNDRSFSRCEQRADRGIQFVLG